MGIGEQFELEKTGNIEPERPINGGAQSSIPSTSVVGHTLVHVDLPCIEEGGRFIPHGYYWHDQHPQFCVHGIKLRWSCDACEERYGVTNGQAQFGEERA